MLIIDGDDKKMLLNHLKILKMYYRQQAKLFKGLEIGRAHVDCHNNLVDFMKRMEAEDETH